MGNYSEPEEVRGTGGVLVAVGTNVINGTAVNRHIVRADNIINTKLNKRYTVPFGTGTSTPPIIKTISTDIAAFFVMRSLFTKDNVNINDWVDDLKKTAEDMLDAIAAGDTKLKDVNDVTITQLEVNDLHSNTKDYHPIFNLDDNLNHKVDQDRLDDIEDARE